MNSCYIAILVAIIFFIFLAIITSKNSPEKYSGVSGYFDCKKECEESRYITTGRNFGHHPQSQTCDKICNEWIGYLSGGLRVPCPGMVSKETCNEYSLRM